jgi:hypothetical protein
MWRWGEPEIISDKYNVVKISAVLSNTISAKRL